MENFVDHDCRPGDVIEFTLDNYPVRATVVRVDFDFYVRLCFRDNNAQFNVSYDELKKWKARYIERAT